MRRLRIVPLVLGAVVLGCGGGGGSNPLAGGAIPQDPADLAQRVVEDCALGTLDDYLDLIASFQALLDPDAAAKPDFRIESIDFLRATITWSLDLNGNGSTDFTGTIALRDARGAPLTTLDLLSLLTGGGLDDLAGLLAGLEDGSQVVTTWTATPPRDASGSFTTVFEGGLPASMSGVGTVRAGDCTGRYGFSGEDFDLLGGRFPVATLEASISGGGVLLEGSVTLDGSSTALLEVTVDGGTETFLYEIDLETGAVVRRA